MATQAPVMIGGMGGSGTRVYHTLCELAGYSMGRFNNSWSRDSMVLHRWFFPVWGDAYMSGRLGDAGLRQMRRHLRLWLRVSHPWRPGAWAVKDPRLLYMLPFLDRVFPEMKFIHALRDGRDHAFNPNFPYRAYEPFLLSAEEARLEDPCRKALHWARLNRRAQAYGEERMPGRYLVSRLENLCTSPRPEVERILAFLGVEDAQVTERCMAAVKVPSSLGRWRREPPEVNERVERTIEPDLQHYGYLGQLREVG